MPPPQELLNWLNKAYPKPRIDPEWLDACYEWVITQHNLNPGIDTGKIISEVENQLLGSDLSDSMLHGTGLPTNLAHKESTYLSGQPVLVQIVSMTDIGVSAFNLNKTRMIREERKAAGEQQEGEADEEIEGEGPIPMYQRSMLRLELSDGSTIMRAMEYRPIPELVLGSTKLGYKILLKRVLIRRGIAFLEPSCIILKGHSNDDLDKLQAASFARSLGHRMGITITEPEEPEVHRDEPAAAEEVASNEQQAQAPREDAEGFRSPLREISPPPVESEHVTHSDDENQPHRRKVPRTSENESAFFSGESMTATSNAMIDAEVKRILALSPAREAPIIIDSDDDDENRMPQMEPAPAKPASPLQNTALKSEDDFDCNDDFWNNLDDAALDQVERAELIALQGRMDSMKPPSQGNAGASQSSQRSVATSRILAAEVITIDDDDEDDKENIPAPTRHVRRRMARQISTDPAEVIDISD